jgi:N-acetylglucosaminyl-diphospho-decaprenol L-rhamnosyltransferase
VNGLDNLRVAVLIVGFSNPQDVQICLSALAQASEQPAFDVFVCENGGDEAFKRLCNAVLDSSGPCAPFTDDLPDRISLAPGRFVKLKRFALKHRASRVWIGCANQNLGYAGGINAWIERLLPIADFQGFWILNPDAMPERRALRALVERSIVANKGMVGSTIVTPDNREQVYCRAGHHWRKLRTSLALRGFGQPVATSIDLAAFEATLDCISGASLYVTRACVENIGLMDERFFLYYEDADWSARAKRCGLGYAPDSIVPHKGGTTIGSARGRAQRSRLSVYLESRNHLHFVRMYWSKYLPFALIFGSLHATMYLLAGSTTNAKAAVQGMLAGIKGETGQPGSVTSTARSQPKAADQEL